MLHYAQQEQDIKGLVGVGDVENRVHSNGDSIHVPSCLDAARRWINPLDVFIALFSKQRQQVSCGASNLQNPRPTIRDVPDDTFGRFPKAQILVLGALTATVLVLILGVITIVRVENGLRRYAIGEARPAVLAHHHVVAI